MTSTGDSCTVEPASPVRVSTVSTSSTAVFSCLPPQRTIAYTEELSLSPLPAFGPSRLPARAGRGHQRPYRRTAVTPSHRSHREPDVGGSSGYQTSGAADARAPWSSGASAAPAVMVVAAAAS